MADYLSIPFFYWYNSSHLSWLTISAFRSSTGTTPARPSWLTTSAFRPPTGTTPARLSWLTIAAFRPPTGTTPARLSWLTISEIRPPTGQFHWYNSSSSLLADYLSISFLYWYKSG